MIRKLLIVGAILSLILLGIHWSLEDQKIMRWADARLEPSSAAAVIYHVGNLCYFFQDFNDAEIYLEHVVKHHPKSPEAEPAHWMWLECSSITHHLPSKDIITECESFLEQHPDGEHVPQVRQILARRHVLVSNQMDMNLAK